MNTYNTLKEIKKNLNKQEQKNLSFRAMLNQNAIRRSLICNGEVGYRQAFCVDIDRIIHSSAYARYIDKTQVFSLIPNDHVTHRVLHVQLVSRIARTIGRFLSINEDLIEAISLGHDIGHAPFGHDGEEFLSKLCRKANIGNFLHNVQSVQFLDKVEKKGAGCNLCLQTLDGILCHDGEIHDRRLIPYQNKTFKSFKAEILNKKTKPNYKIIPMTYEGCVVRLADIISYIGRDLEDAIRLKLLKRSEIPKEISSCIGDTNSNIVYNLVTDVIQSSYSDNSIGFSLDVSDVLKELMRFNYERIYTNLKIKKNHKIIENLFDILFERSMEDLETKNWEANIFSNFLNGISSEYVENHSYPEIVRDYIAGMTDGYFLSQFDRSLRPVSLEL